MSTQQSQKNTTALGIVSVCSVVLLMFVIGWNIWSTYHPTTNPLAHTSATPTTKDSASDTTLLTTNDVIQQLASQYSTTSTSSVAAFVAADIAPRLNPTVITEKFAEADIKTSTDTSYKAMMLYRSNLQVSLAPLLKNSAPEIAVWGMYVETKDKTYLTQLTTISGYYKDAIKLTRAIVVPGDAVSYQIHILNAMSSFSSTLDTLIDNAADPIASAALLKYYNQAEQDMFNSFNDLGVYYRSKKQ